MKILSSFDPEQLKIGTDVELEHTSDRKIAEKIAKDHLKECPNYYTRLLKMEKECDSEKASVPDNDYVFFDTEFYENGEVIIPISIGMVKGLEGNEHLYLVNADFDYDWMVADAKSRGSEETIEFLDKNVFNNICATSENTFSMSIIKDIMTQFLPKVPCLWASTASYDWILLCQMFGRMVDKPKEYPYFPMDTAQLKKMFPQVTVDYSCMPDNSITLGCEHNALFDAYETRCKYLSYRKFVTENKLPISL